MTPRVSIIIVSYNHARYLRACFASLEKIDYPRDCLQITLVDNKSADDTVRLAQTELLDSSLQRTISGLPARLIASPTNTGFAGGNNMAMREAIEAGFDYVFLLNPDTEVEPTFLTEAVKMAESDSKIAAVQPLLLLHPDTDRINSIGNAIHFLGFGYCQGYREKWDPRRIPELDGRDIATASGAGVLFRCESLRKVGLFDETLFAYHEDLDLSWRLRLAGFRVVLAPKSVVYHKYEFSRSIKKYYWMERNRYLVHAKNLKIPTLLLIAPAMILMEIGLWLFAFRSGWWREKTRVAAWLWNPLNWPPILRARRQIQKTRVIPDRDIVKYFTAEISYQEISNPLLKYVGNPLMKLYWAIVRPLIRW
ncbi:hypothetical protein A3D72_00930 [Candidatus Uhrbacteria bacterium RIFCSPHIGHO2_02_FULL_57_19]|uniref:Glycosyltransferase 2-like domain-containing protein n=1 Tax=Candidatus Uhrbacteria bacterium RIFCSPHIGHO2_02_FULL_57_19 TaxID=1802391 RepID=A0A1F7U2D5_9BACT|nr:MAG: hypothetical protein A3D72_00930 [Candidatus Uhrbacteria bacterium RIFCSPHIGHO2_02_FULL_57_19]